MQLTATTTRDFTTPTPPPPPGPGFGRVAEEITRALPISTAKSGVLAEVAVRYGRTGADAVAAWKSAYSLASVNQDEATVLGMVTLVAGARPTAIADAYKAAYALASVSGTEASDLSTRMVLRGYNPANLQPTYQRLYSISEVSGEMAEAMTKAAVSGNAGADQVADAYTWYRAQPGGSKEQATTWTVDHLRKLGGGFDTWHDQMLADFRSRIAAAR